MLNAIGKVQENCIPNMNTSCGKVLLAALSVISIIAGVVATGCLYSSMGTGAFWFLAEGGTLALIPMAVLVCNTSFGPKKVIRPLIILEQSNTSAIERWKSHQQPFDMSDMTIIEHSVKEEAVTGDEPIYNRAMGVMLGTFIGDTMGYSFAHLPFNSEEYVFDQRKVNSELEHGQWTSDCSLTLCLADVLIQDKRDLDVGQLLWAFYDNAHHGYNSPFTKGEYHPPMKVRNEVSQTLELIPQNREIRASAYPTNAASTGNGSLVRTGPVALIAQSAEQAMDMAYRQSKATNNNEVVAACCQLMAFVIFHLIQGNELIWEEFNCNCKDVNDLARNWQNKDFTFQHSKDGSHCLDALSWALHCVFTTEGFENAIKKATIHGGEAHAFGSITGQIAGARYGKKGIDRCAIDAVQAWDRGGEIATRGLLLKKVGERLH